MKQILFALAFFPLIISAQTNQCLDERYAETALFDSTDIEIDYNTVYANVDHYFTGANMDLVMDVYYANATADTLQQRPFILLIHGGSFAFGNKNDLAFTCHQLARRGFVVATMQYRLGWGCDASNILALCQNPLCFCPLCNATNLKKGVYMAVQDARAAMRFVFANAAQWNVDTDWMFAGGVSAGSITAMLATTWNQTEADAWAPAGFAAEVGSLDESGNNLPTGYEIKALVNDCGAVVNLNDLDNNPNLPIISFHDSNDIVVPYNTGQVMSICPYYFYAYGSLAIHTHRLAQNECTELNTVEALNHCGYPMSNLVNRASCFLKRVMCGVCTSHATIDPYEPVACASLAAVGVGIAGCTYSQASNYNQLATIDDGSCIFPADNCPSDLNNDGIINVTDLLLFMAGYGQVCE